MPSRVIIAADPGNTGALAAIVGGRLVKLRDMPTKPRGVATKSRPNPGNRVDPYQVAEFCRAVMAANPGAQIVACIELVQPQPTDGVVQTWRFSEATALVCGVYAGLDLPIKRVAPQTWKRYFALLKAPKDSSRLVAAERCENAADFVQRKMDHNRADAILIALWAYETEEEGAK